MKPLYNRPHIQRRHVEGIKGIFVVIHRFMLGKRIKVVLVPQLTTGTMSRDKTPFGMNKAKFGIGYLIVSDDAYLSSNILGVNIDFKVTFLSLLHHHLIIVTGLITVG